MNTQTQPECTRCSELLMEYITAGNELVDAKTRLTRTSRLSASQLSSVLLQRALERRSLMRKRLALHQSLHRLHACSLRV